MVLPMSSPLHDVEVLGPLGPGYSDILTPQALAFIALLARTFESKRRELHALRARRQDAFDAGFRSISVFYP